MPNEKSCGAIIFNLDGGERRYLLIREKYCGDWAFPKGHVMPSESEEETALREVKEETGLIVALLKGFRREKSHNLARQNRPNDIKTNVYFLAEYKSQTPKPQAGEVSEIRLAEYETARNLLSTQSLKALLDEADSYLNKTGL